MLTQKRPYLLIIIAASILVRAAAALYMGDRIEPLPGIFDQISYQALAESLLQGKGYQFLSAWYPFTPANTPTAHWSFLYPIYLAAVYSVSGIHPLAARLLQAVIAGAAMPWLTYLLGERLFNKQVGLVAAMGTAFYGYFIYHNAALMTETFYILLILWAFSLAYEMVDTGSDKSWWQLGFVMGLTVVFRQVYLFFVPILLIWVAYAGRGKIRWSRLVLALLLVGLCIAPWTIRNYQRYHTLLLLNSNSGYALYTSNHPDQGTRWQDDYTAPLPADLQGQNEAEMDRALTQRGIQFIFKDPRRFLSLTLSRIPYLFQFWPSSHSGLINNLVRTLSFGLYLPFMLAGLILSRRNWRRFIPIYLFTSLFIAIHITSWPGPRYRFPIDAVCMVFAGFAVCLLAQQIRTLRTPKSS